MCEIDKKLQEVRARRIMFMSDLNTLECDHHKLYKKLIPIFDEINQWMYGAENYMNELKQSISMLEVIKENNQYVGIAKTPLNQNYYDNFILVEKHNKQNGA